MILEGNQRRLDFDKVGDGRVLISVSWGEDFAPYIEDLDDLEGHDPVELIYDGARKLRIFSWVKRDPLQAEPQCDLTFDVRKFYASYNDVGIRKEDGRNAVIQESILPHRDFKRMMRSIIMLIENEKARSVSFICAWGKHRSVAFAEILKKMYYPRSTTEHLKFSDKKKK